MANSKANITVHIEEMEKELLKKYCERMEFGMSTLIRRALREYLIKRRVLKEDSRLFVIIK